MARLFGFCSPLQQAEAKESHRGNLFLPIFVSHVSTRHKINIERPFKTGRWIGIGGTRDVNSASAASSARHADRVASSGYLQPLRSPRRGRWPVGDVRYFKNKRNLFPSKR